MGADLTDITLRLKGGSDLKNSGEAVPEKNDKDLKAAFASTSGSHSAANQRSTREDPLKLLAERDQFLGLGVKKDSPPLLAYQYSPRTLLAEELLRADFPNSLKEVALESQISEKQGLEAENLVKPLEVLDLGSVIRQQEEVYTQLKKEILYSQKNLSKPKNNPRVSLGSAITVPLFSLKNNSPSKEKYNKKNSRQYDKMCHRLFSQETLLNQFSRTPVETKAEIIARVKKLLRLYLQGSLGQEKFLMSGGREEEWQLFDTLNCQIETVIAHPEMKQ